MWFKDKSLFFIYNILCFKSVYLVIGHLKFSKSYYLPLLILVKSRYNKYCDGKNRSLDQNTNPSKYVFANINLFWKKELILTDYGHNYAFPLKTANQQSRFWETTKNLALKCRKLEISIIIGHNEAIDYVLICHFIMANYDRDL